MLYVLNMTKPPTESRLFCKNQLASNKVDAIPILMINDWTMFKATRDLAT